ncbi:MAG: Ig-like domain-containing protein [Eubacterium sp.]|nr:Ig-like domain-containing protein [Eubacterium sp.]
MRLKISRICILTFLLAVLIFPAFNASALDSSEKIVLDKETATIGKGEEINVYDFIADENKSDNVYTYESKSTSIATVDENGIVTGMKKGKTSIIITRHIFENEETIDEETGETINREVEYTINKHFRVEVDSAPSKVKLSAHNILIGVKKTYNLDYVISGGTANEKSFVSSDDKIATVNENGVVKGKTSGVVTITFKTYNGVSDKCKVTVSKSAPSLKIADANTKIQKGSNNHKFKISFKAGKYADKTVRIHTSDKKILWIKDKTYAVGAKKGTVTVSLTTNYDNIKAQRKFKVINESLSLSRNSYQLSLDRDNVKRVKYGKSVNGRPLEGYIITNAKTGKYKKTLFMDFAVHGFEDFYAKDGKKLVAEANRLIEYFATHSSELGKYRLVIVPCANPDGTISGRNNLRACSKAYGRCTAKHVDMNRDFGPFKALESRKLRDFIKECKPNVYLNMHGWLNETLGSYNLCRIINKAQGFHKYIGSFGADSHYIIAWVNKNLGIPSALVEYKGPKSISKKRDIKMIKNIIKAY